MLMFFIITEPVSVAVKVHHTNAFKVKNTFTTHTFFLGNLPDGLRVIHHSFLKTVVLISIKKACCPVISTLF